MYCFQFGHDKVDFATENNLELITIFVPYIKIFTEINT